MNNDRESGIENALSTAGLALTIVGFFFLPVVFGLAGIILCACGWSKGEPKGESRFLFSFFGTLFAIFIWILIWILYAFSHRGI